VLDLDDELESGEEHFVQLGGNSSPRAGPVPLHFFDARWS
jgi:hypothetical protein